LPCREAFPKLSGVPLNRTVYLKERVDGASFLVGKIFHLFISSFGLLPNAGTAKTSPLTIRNSGTYIEIEGRDEICKTTVVRLAGTHGHAMKILVWNINALVGQAVSVIHDWYDVQQELQVDEELHLAGFSLCSTSISPSLQAPTVKNFVLKHGSLGGFFESYDADIICFQVREVVVNQQRLLSAASLISKN